MHNINPNYALFKKHLRSLNSQDLIPTKKSKYTTTQKGHLFLELFPQLNYLLNC
jgi:predicted transcriptional regulator